ncbi:hypothetical protein IJ750_01635 [bacterium]|nr:hypothetical protein [bacterium]
MLIILFTFILVTTSVFAFAGTGTKYRKHTLPYKYDPYFIYNFENCIKSDYVDWDGTYKYLILGKENNRCHYKTQYNPWLRTNKNEWQDFKECYFNENQLYELSNALKEEGYKKELEISTYNISIYKITGTRVEFLLTSYEQGGACRLIKKKTAKR